MSSGYSKTPLTKKLGLKAGFKIHLNNVPDYYIDLFDELPKNLVFTKAIGVLNLDFIHAFFTQEENLKASVHKLKDGIKQTGILWVSWPKGKSKIKTDINRELVRSVVLDAGLVDTKVCAVNEDWSGLKFMYRLKDRK